MKLLKKQNHLISIIEKQTVEYLEKNSINIQQHVLSRHKRSNGETLEEATDRGEYDYWLSQEDIADIARLEYANFHKQNNVEISDFEIVGSLQQLITQTASFLVKAKEVSSARHTMVINMGAMHWVTLVFSYQDRVTRAYYVNSLGSSLQPEYHPLFQTFEVELIDLSQYCYPQQTDAYNCGLWALENAADINKMLDENQSIEWLILQLERPRNTAYFSARRQSISELLRADVDRYRRISQQEESIAAKTPTQSIAGLRRPLESPQVLEPLAKKIKPLTKEEKVAMSLELFVHKFMLNFIKRLGLYHITAKENRITEQAFKAELKTGATGALVGISTAQSIVGSIPSIVASVRTLSSQYYLSKSKAQKITRIFSTLTDGSLNRLLSEAGVEIFKSYESQFMHVTDKAGDKMAIEKLAEDAGARALNYIAENAGPNQLISNELITQGVVLGKSEKFFDPSFKNVRIRISGNRIQDGYGKAINTANLFEKTGLFLPSAPEKPHKFYRLKDALDSSKYGYRYPLNWEIEKKGELKSEYQEKYLQETVLPDTENQFQYFSRRYEYLDYLETFSIKQTAQDILHKIALPTEVKREESVISPKKGPIIFNLRNPIENFSGRKEVLIQLHNLISGKNIGVVSHLLASLSLDSAAKPIRSSHSLASLSGLGGIGKTQLALRYAQQYADIYDHNVIWINAETKNDIWQCLRKLATQLDINIKDSYGNLKDTGELTQEIYHYFSAEKSLFIFDNVENYQEFSGFFPKVLKGNTPTLLITSRYSNWKNIAPVLSIDTFTEQEAQEFIKTELLIENDQQDGKIRELMILLQGLPLALQQAVAYIDVQRNVNNDYRISDYINQYKLKSQEILNFDFFNYSNDPYAKTVFLTWQITLDKIKQDLLIGEKALEILNIMAYLHPDSIANALFLPLENPEKLVSAIHLLRSYSMLNQQNQPDISVIHRLVQQVVRINLERDIEAFQRVAEQTIKITENFYHNKETELHYIHFLLHMSQYDQLALALNLGFTHRRVLDILIYSNYDVNIATIYDNARLIMCKEGYYYFMGESLHYILKRGLLFFLSETLNYLEKNLVEEVITREDISSIIEYRYKMAVKYKGRWLVPGAIERARQLGALRLFFEFEHTIFPQGTMGCYPERKKRGLEHRCSPREFFSMPKRISPQEFIQHLQRVGQLAEFAATGMLTKDILSDLLQGKLSHVAMNLGLITGSTFLGEVSNLLLTQGEILTATEKQLLVKDLALNGKLAFNILFHEDVIPLAKRLFLGNAIKVAAPFVGRGISISSNAYYLFNEIQAYHQGDSKVLPDLMANSMMLGLDGLQSGVKAAEYLELIEGISDIIGPLGEAASLAIWVGSDIERAKKQEEWIEKYVHLNIEEKGWERLRAFAHFAPSAYLEAKAYNNQLVKLAIAFLKNNTDIQAYIFPAASSATQLYANNAVFLRNQTSIKLSATNPDPSDEGELFCFSGLKESEAYIRPAEWLYLAYPPTQFIDFVTVYLCKNAIGVKYMKNRTGNIHLIALGEGDDQVVGAPDTPTLMHVNNGDKNYIGGDAGNVFILEGDAMTGLVQGGKGINVVKFEEVFLNDQYYTSLIDYNGLACSKTPNFSNKLCEKGLKLKQIQKILGIKNQKDIFFIADKNIKYVDGLGGKNPILRDEIYITNKTANNLEIGLRPNTIIHCFETFNESATILYTLQANQTGEAWMHFDFNGPIYHRFYVDFSLDALYDIVTHPYVFTLHFFEQQSFNLTLSFPLLSRFNQSQAEMLNHVNYMFANNVQIKFNHKNLFIQENSNRTLEQSIHYYSSIAQRLKRTLKIYLAQNETLQIAYGRQEFLSNDVSMRSHLIAQGGQAFYRIISGSQLNFPNPEVVIYAPNGVDDFTKTLDLTDIWQQARQACPEDNIVLRISEVKQDLIISVEVNYYPIGTECVRLENSWPVTKIKLRAACVSNWYQQLEVILNKKSLTIIGSEEGDWHFEHYPLIFNQDKELIVLTEENLVHERDVLVLKPIDSKQYRFFCHNKTDLIFMNDWNSVTRLFDPTLIIYSRFYQDERMREKTLASVLSFLDRQIILSTHKEQIDQAYKQCINFSNISLTQLDEPKFASRKEKNSDKYTSDSSVRLKRQINSPKAEFVTALFHSHDRAASNNPKHPANVLLDKTEEETTKKSIVSVKVKRKPIISYFHRNTKRKRHRLKNPHKIHYVSTNPDQLFFPEQIIGFNPANDHKSIDFRPLDQQDIQRPVIFNDALTNISNLLLFSVFLNKKKGFLLKSAKTQLPFTNKKDEIDEIENRVIKALSGPRFF
ncbi:MAG: NB-ARC domain-containing protein [Candidatus Aquirickettsiella sp.]